MRLYYYTPHTYLSIAPGGIEDKLISSILDTPSPGDHPDFWQCMYGLVLKGRLAEARDLLSHHSLVHSMPNVSYSQRLAEKAALQLGLLKTFRSIHV